MAVPPDHVVAVLEQADLLYSESQVEYALDSLAGEISARLEDKNPLVLCVMVGAIVVAGKLVSRLNFPLQIDYVHATRYAGATRGGELQWIAKPATALQGRTVLIVDDILDEGLTLQAIIEWCRAAGATDVYTAVLVEKQRLRAVEINIDFKGLDVEDRYVVGYGMDYQGYLRNVAGIYAINEDQD
jgi:hypoxanthine phosphoribosyltransferase